MKTQAIFCTAFGCIRSQETQKGTKPEHIVIKTLLEISEKNVIDSADQQSLKVIAKYLKKLQTEIKNQFTNPERNQKHERITNNQPHTGNRCKT